MSGRLIILAGPSCVGKSPLYKAIGRLYPEIMASWQPLVLYNDRSPRPGEKDGQDYHFRSKEYIETLRSDERYFVKEVRGDLQALDIENLASQLRSEVVIFEGNPFIGGLLIEQAEKNGFPYLSVFMSPLSAEEISFLNGTGSKADLPALVTDIMRRKLLRRTRKQKGELSLKDLENIEKRASSAYGELKMAYRYKYVIPNHDGEDNENWDAFYYPIGDALRSLQTFVSLLRKEPAPHAEQWKADLFPS